MDSNRQGQIPNEEEDADDNITLQREELEALSSIYGEDFILEEVEPPTLRIRIRLNNVKEEASLMISFGTNYPKASPPIYQLSIPWIRGDHKKAIYATLQQLHADNFGESIVYILVEKLREILEGESESECDADLESQSQNPFQNQEEEKNPISDKLIASACSDSDSNSTTTGFSIANNNQTFHNRTTTVPSHSSSSSLLLHPSHENKTLVGCKIPKIITGEPFTDRKSTFQAHVAPCCDVQHVRVVLDELYKNKKIASATHNIYAFRIFKEDKNTSNWIQDCEDDGETQAGGRLLHLIQILNCRNVLVVVTRWYGGIQLHADRFKHINNVARQLLEEQGFINNSIKK